MMEHKTEGVLLQTIPYLGAQKILKVFTPDVGLLSLIVKSPSLSGMTSPFIQAEWVYRKGKEDLHLLKDATLLNAFPKFREDYRTISSAGAIARDLLRSQLPAKPAHALYALLLSYWHQLPHFLHPETLVASFRLKFLLHEGVLSLQPLCTQCASPARHLLAGESVCLAHAESNSLFFEEAAWNQLQQLAYARRFTCLQKIELSQATQDQIKFIFEANHSL